MDIPALGNGEHKCHGINSREWPDTTNKDFMVDVRDPSFRKKLDEPAGWGRWVAISRCCEGGQVCALSCVLACGVDVGHKTLWRWSPLHSAFHTGRDQNPAVALLLLRAGVDPADKDRDGNPAWRMKINEKDPIIPRMSLQELANSDSRVRLRQALREGEDDAELCMQRILYWCWDEAKKHLGPLFQDFQKYSPWPRIARARRVAAWRRAVEAKRDASMVFKAAAEGRPMELARRLRLGKLAGGLAIKGNVGNGEMGSPLLASIGNGHQECVGVLQDHGARLVAEDLARLAVVKQRK